VSVCSNRSRPTYLLTCIATFSIFHTLSLLRSYTPCPHFLLRPYTPIHTPCFDYILLSTRSSLYQGPYASNDTRPVYRQPSCAGGASHQFAFVDRGAHRSAAQLGEALYPAQRDCLLERYACSRVPYSAPTLAFTNNCYEELQKHHLVSI
jgi:hypothetical protein